jgi:hypothetical protein
VAQTTLGKRIYCGNLTAHPNRRMMAVPDACPGDRAQCLLHRTRSDHNRRVSSIMAIRCVRDSARVFNPNPPRVPQQASDLIAVVVLALVLANIALLMALSS